MKRASDVPERLPAATVPSKAANGWALAAPTVLGVPIPVAVEALRR
jgi:hypothetical protein